MYSQRSYCAQAVVNSLLVFTAPKTTTKKNMQLLTVHAYNMVLTLLDDYDMHQENLERVKLQHLDT